MGQEKIDIEDAKAILREGICSWIVKGNYKWGLQHGISLGYTEGTIHRLFELCDPFLKILVTGIRASIDSRVRDLAKLLPKLM